MKPLDEILKKDVYFISKKKGVASHSLRTALEAYFATYQTFKFYLHLFEKGNNFDDEIKKMHHSKKYEEQCMETIIHFQHFFELTLKSFLRDDHPLLADEAINKPVILYKLLYGQTLSPDEEQGIKSISFSETTERLFQLIDSGQLKNHQKLKFLKKYKKTFEKLNILRNRIWHRGTLVLMYPSLDVFVGGYLLPIVIRIARLENYKTRGLTWKYKKLDCRVDPISKIVSECKKNEPDLKKIAFLKEMGRAAYQNPLEPVSSPNYTWAKYANNKHINRAQSIAKLISKDNDVKVKKCPVCGVQAFLVFYEIEDGVSIPEDGSFENAYRYTSMAKCECCTFEVESSLQNPKKYGLKVEDFWEHEYL